MSAASEAPDFSRHARKATERLQIVEHVFETPLLEETDYLEWKVGYELSQRPGAASTARQLIGLANRDTTLANRHAEGHAYLLLGVAPGTLPGVPHWDSANIENWLSPFVGADVRYDVHYVEKDGKEVLFLTVDPPLQGDPTYCLRQSSQDPDGKSLRRGTVYVRHGSKTEPGTPEDIDRLTARANSTEETKLELALALDPSEVRVVNPTLVMDAIRDERLRAWRAEMVAKVPKPASGGLGTFSPALLEARAFGESRTRKQYADEIDLYIQTVRGNPETWLRIMACEWLEAGHSKLGVRVTNDSDENYENAVVELTFPLGRGHIHVDARDVERVLSVPDKPAPWGETLALLTRSVPTISSRFREPQPEIESLDTSVTLVRYPEFRVRPHTPHPMKPILLALAPPFAGRVIPVRWRVTASNAKSDQRGELELRVQGGPEEGEGAPEPAVEPTVGQQSEE